MQFVAKTTEEVDDVEMETDVLSITIYPNPVKDGYLNVKLSE